MLPTTIVTTFLRYDRQRLKLEVLLPINKEKWKLKESKKNFIRKRNTRAIIVAHSSNRVVIFQLVFYLQWMQFSQHSEAIPFYHGHSNPIGRAVEIPHISIYMSSLHSICIQGEPSGTLDSVQMKK